MMEITPKRDFWNLPPMSPQWQQLLVSSRVSHVEFRENNNSLQPQNITANRSDGKPASADFSL